MMQTSNETALQSLIDDLRQRVAEAEETLAAIRDGSVDAVLVGGGGQDEVLVIGDDVTVGHSVTLHGCTLENGCFIGMQAMVMDKAVVGEGALVGARALVTEGTIIPPHTLWVGAPAKYKRDLTPDEIAWLKRSAGNYVRYSRQYIED